MRPSFNLILTEIRTCRFVNSAQDPQKKCQTPNAGSFSAIQTQPNK